MIRILGVFFFVKRHVFNNNQEYSERNIETHLNSWAEWWEFDDFEHEYGQKEVTLV